ncbi:MAG: hypothetical protein ACR2N6_00660 [Miltoncostaeaceae bacterium]
MAALVVGTAILAPAPVAMPATVTLSEPSPRNGAVLPTQPAPYRVPLVWTADTAGCSPGVARTEVVIRGPRGLETRGTVDGAPPSGGRSFVVSPPRRSTYRWFVQLTCPGLGPVFSEGRAFTLAGPNSQPRLHGRYRARFLAADTVEIWRFRALCRTGACDTVVRRPGARATVLRFDARRRTYRGRFGRVSRPREAVCSIEGGRGRVRTIPRTYRAGSADVVVRVGLTEVDPSGIQRRATRLLGRSSGRYLPNTRGRRLGCRPGGIVTPLVLERVQRARPAVGEEPLLAP